MRRREYLTLEERVGDVEYSLPPTMKGWGGGWITSVFYRLREREKANNNREDVWKGTTYIRRVNSLFYDKPFRCRIE